MERFVLGSVYLGGLVQEPGFACDNLGEVSIGDTVPGKGIQWVKLKSGLLVADRYICTNISWRQLDEKGFVFGAPVTINGKTYLCRCLKVSEPNEWDAALDEVGEYNDLWHWNGIFFWVQETSELVGSIRVVRGWASARHWDYFDAATQLTCVGFRPALEYLGAEPCSPDALLGKNIKVYRMGGVPIEGSLVDFNEYDVVLEASSQVPVDCPWITKEGCNIIVSRENICWLKEAEMQI